MPRPRYILDSRAVHGAPEKGDDLPAAPCIFCGEIIKHVNDGGVGWLLGAVVDGKANYYLYCLEQDCPIQKLDAEENPPVGSIWRCGCQPDYVENVGDTCHACMKPFAERTEVECCGCGKASLDPCLLCCGKKKQDGRLH